MSSKTKPKETEGTSSPSKVCVRCGVGKAADQFNVDRAKSDKLASTCRECNRTKCAKYYALYPDRFHRNMLKAKYHITSETYAEMLEAQGNGCKICGKPCGTGYRLAVDHVKGSEPPKVRGLLCAAHNTGIGLFDHDVALLKNAIQYLNDNAH